MKPLRHAKAILFVHFVWGPRHRQDVLDEEFWDMMPKFVVRLSNAEQFTIIASNGTEDHIHVLVEHRPDISVSAIVKRIKGSLTHEIRKRVPEFSWQDGYGAFSVSPTAVARVMRYIDKQKEHHAKGTTKIEWEDGVDTYRLSVHIGPDGPRPYSSLSHSRAALSPQGAQQQPRSAPFCGPPLPPIVPSQQ